MARWRLDGTDPDDHRDLDAVRDDAVVARDRGRGAFDDMNRREREREEAEAAAEQERRQARRARVSKLLKGRKR